MSDQQIYIIETEKFDAYAKGGPGQSVIWNSAQIEDIKNGLSDFLKDISTLFSDVEETIGDLQLKEITLNVGIKASGKIGLIGSVESGVEGGLSIKLTKKHE